MKRYRIHSFLIMHDTSNKRLTSDALVLLGVCSKPSSIIRERNLNPIKELSQFPECCLSNFLHFAKLCDSESPFFDMVPFYQ